MNTIAGRYIPMILCITGVITACFAIYFCMVSIIGAIKKIKKIPPSYPQTKFAVIIAARNEENVIGHLIDSLIEQNYPKDLYDIYVIPNNCTDKTQEVALTHGANIFTSIGPIKSKGEVLTQAVDYILDCDIYDAICVFDADNLVHPDFLNNMNNSYISGVHVAQGYRDSKNVRNNVISTCSAISFWILSNFYNGGREALGLSSVINGTGFMVSIEMLKKLGGWHTTTMTEDYEFSAQCVLAGERVHYVPEAIIYDEQPTNFHQSWKQRRRWSTGRLQGTQCFFKKLIKESAKRKSLVCLDLAITFATPFLFLISLGSGVLTTILYCYRMIEYSITPQLKLIMNNAMIGFIGCTVLALLTLLVANGVKLRGMKKGALFFTFFLITWLPIEVISFFNKKTTWEPIAHNGSMDCEVHHEYKI